jgi:hypothetical protein
MESINLTALGQWISSGVPDKTERLPGIFSSLSINQQTPAVSSVPPPDALRNVPEEKLASGMLRLIARMPQRRARSVFGTERDKNVLFNVAEVGRLLKLWFI